MEAGRYGKPVIARRLPVLQELLKNGEAGLLVGKPEYETNSNKLTVNELTSAIESLLDDSSLRRALGESCKIASEAFIWDKVAVRFEDSYLRAIEKRSL
jgi:glycosyltransferase involved in cell wall biosynthesis